MRQFTSRVSKLLAWLVTAQHVEKSQVDSYVQMQSVEEKNSFQ